MDMERKRVAPNSSKTGVVMGSVWESRMKGSLKVFNGDDKIQETENKNNQSESFRSKQSPNGVGKRKTWKSDGNSEGNERSPVQISKVRSENKKELSDSIEGIGIKKSPVAVQVKKGRPEWNRVASVSIDGIERSPVQRSVKTRSLSRKVSTSSDLKDVIDECNDGIQERDGGNRGDDEGKNNTSDCSQSLDVCEEKLMMVELKRVKSLDSEEDSDKVTLEKNEEVNEERAIVIVKEPEPEPEPVLTIHKKKLSDVVIEEKKIHHRNERSNLVSKTVRKQLPPVVNHQKTSSKPNEFPLQRVPKSHSKLQSLIDLIMWKDASKSALVFGFGTFSILSSSYTQDLNISFISVISYLSLIYLAATFIFKSFILRGVVQSDNITDDDEYVVGEEEAIWALKLFLPYINEFLLKVKALFSGDPATTMKMAVLLFILARCGSSITIWKMAKLAFFGLFTVPKICSSYSSQLSAYGAFWIQRFKDAWDSCSQKKAVAFGVFTLVWNLSSMVARIWAVFMLLVAFKFYQQSMTKDDQVVEEEEPIIHRNQSSWQEQRNGRIFASTESTKFKKRS
ncbi:putative reticulon-like protein B17/18/21 [Helianthus debilis subsp. tardiflorus]